jgi:hypothetical protein
LAGTGTALFFSGSFLRQTIGLVTDDYFAGPGTKIFSGRLFCWQPTEGYYLRFGGNLLYYIFQKIVFEAADWVVTDRRLNMIWRESALQYFLADSFEGS